MWSTFVHAAPLSSVPPSVPSSPSSQSGAPTANKGPSTEMETLTAAAQGMLHVVSLHTGAPHSVVGVEGFRCSCMGVMLILLCECVCPCPSTSLYMWAMTEQSPPTFPIQWSDRATPYALIWVVLYMYILRFYWAGFQYDRFCTFSWVHSCSNCTVCSEHVNFVDVLFEAVCCSAKCDHWTTCNRWGVYDI